MPAVAALAAFSHHLMVTAMMLPIMMRLARVQNLSPSRLLMPMSLAASLGTTLTIFSAPAFLLMNHLLQTGEQATLGVFGITPIGVALVLLAIVYMFLARWILPKRKARADEADYLRLDRYYTELMVEPRTRAGSARRWRSSTSTTTAGSRSSSGCATGCRSTTRTAARCWPPATCCSSARRPTRSRRSRASPGLALHAVKKYGDTSEREVDESPQLVQVVVAPHSPFIGETIGAIDFHKTFDVVVVGLWRRQDWIRDRMSQVQLREGDLLVLRGTPDRFAELASHHGFLMMVPFSGQAASPPARHARAADRGGRRCSRPLPACVPAQMAFLGGAVALVLTVLRRRRPGLPRDRRAHLRDDRGRDPARPRHGKDRHRRLSRAAA